MTEEFSFNPFYRATSRSGGWVPEDGINY